VNNIKMDLKERGWFGIDWIDLAQNRDQWRAVVNMAMNIWVPLKVVKFFSSCTSGSFSISVQLHGVNIWN
jgi:hypothetical protein